MMDEIKKRRAALPVRLYVEDDEAFRNADWPGVDYDECAHTVTPDPAFLGWTNDGGHPGYGLPFDVAEALAAAPEDIDWLIAHVESLEKALAAERMTRAALEVRLKETDGR
jgi:hypothetical protein